jgi:hypothetical protein
MAIAILYPVLAQIILTFIVMFGMGWARQKAMRTHHLRYGDIAIDAARWPDESRKFANNFSNQFELPVIFYVLCLIALMTGKADFLMLVLAWAFVASRALHAFIHTGSNAMPLRSAVFFIGAVLLMVMTGILLVRLLTAV